MAKIIITIEIGEPKKKGPRDIIVSGAPAGEMPVIKSGVFADRHMLADAVYAELQRREPQVPKHTGVPPALPKKETPEEEEKRLAEIQQIQDDVRAAAEPVTEQPAVGDAPEDDQLVALATEPPADLPVITEDPAAQQPAVSEFEAAIIAAKSEE